MTVPVILRPSPFRLETRQHLAAPGQSIADILRDVPDLPPEIWTHGVVRIGEVEVARAHWAHVKPKPGSRHLIHVGVRLGDGGGGGGKSTFGTIAAIALVVAAGAISGGALAGVAGTTLFAAGSTSAALLSAGVSIVGALALSALAPTAASPTSQDSESARRAEAGSASIQGNILEPFAPIPFVAGTHRVAPPHLILPWTENLNDDQFVYAIVGLNGAHQFTDIRINDAPIDDFDDVEYEVRDVVTDDTDITLITKQVYENQTGVEISGHKLKDDAGDELQDEDDPSNSYPAWHGVRSRTTPEEIWLSFAWTGLVAQQDAGGTARAGVPLRIRIRRAGETTWINLPEFHAQRERLEPFRGMIKLRFEAAGPSLTRLDQDVSLPPWSHALYLTDSDNDESYDVDSFFDLGSGNNADNVSSESGIAVVWLDPETFTPGIYDVQVMRGYGYEANDFTPSTYVYDSATPYFFTHIPASSPPAIRKDQAKIASRLSLQSVSSAWNEYPLREKGLSLIAVKAKNVAISSLTVLATGYANVWDGADWDAFEPTNNPAAWWRYLALGGQSARATFIEAQLDDDNLAEWYDYCGDERTKAVTFDGNDYLTRGGGLTGAADSKLWTFSCWFYVTDASGGRILSGLNTLGGSDGRTRAIVTSIGDGVQFTLFGVDSAHSAILDIKSSEFPLNRWVHIMASVDMSDTAKRHIYLDDQEDLASVPTYADDIIDFTFADWAIGAYANGTVPFEGGLAELWSAPGVYIDLSIEANRRKFISANGRPVNLGSDGSVPTGSAPLVYMSGDLPGWIANKGTGGGFTENGALTASVVSGSAGVRNRECNAFFDGRQSLADVLRIVAATGRAAVRLSDKVGVVIDRDRSAEAPIQLFSQRNARGLSIRRAFPRIPDGLRVRFNDEDNNYQPEEIFVYRKPVASPLNIEAISYTGITSRSQAIDRAYLDLAQMLRRGRIYSLETDIENLYCIKGSRVALAYDTLARHYDAARVVSVQTSGGNVTGLTLDAPLRLALIGELGASYPAGVVIQLKDGTTLTEEIDEEVDSDTITFATPFAIPAGDILEEDCLVACGPLSSVEKPMVVLGIQPQDQYTASLTLLDAADPVLVIAPGPDDVIGPSGERILAPF